MSRTAAEPAAPHPRREAILDAAERLFAEQGYSGAALSEIARAAGLGNAGLIHHFPGKAALYRAVLERLAADIDARLEAGLSTAADPAERLRVFVRVQLDWALQRPQALRLIQRELLDNADRVRSARSLPLAGFVAAGMALVEAAQAAGRLAPGPPEVLLNLLLGPLSYAAAARPTFAQMLDGPLLRDEAGWLEAVADGVLEALLPGAAQGAAGQG